MSLLAAVSLGFYEQPRQVIDPVEVGLQKFGMHPADCRVSLLNTYGAEDLQFEEARDRYLACLAETAVLVCTATEQPTPKGVLAIGPGLAASGITAILMAERISRLQGIDRMYAATARTAFDLGRAYFRRGPINTLARELGVGRTAHDVAQVGQGDVQTIVRAATIDAATAQREDAPVPVDLRNLAYGSMMGTVLKQTAQERALLSRTLIQRSR